VWGGEGQLADCRRHIISSPVLRVASLESTRMYDNLVEIKVKDTSEGKADPSDYFCVDPDQDVDV